MKIETIFFALIAITALILSFLPSTAEFTIFQKEIKTRFFFYLFGGLVAADVVTSIFLSKKKIIK